MNKRGQSIIEYSFIAVLVVLGIVIMGPYVLRSVNAHFKFWDDAVEDSFDDRLTQASNEEIPDISLECDCHDTTACSSGTCEGIACPLNELCTHRDCSPPGCMVGKHLQITDPCRPDPDPQSKCCSAFAPAACGTVPIPTNFVGGDGTINIPAGTPPAGATDCSDKGCLASNCYYGQRIFNHLCGNDPRIECHADTTCEAQCLGTIEKDGNGNPIAQFCPNANAGLTQPTPISYVGNDQTTCSGAKCEAYCKPGYIKDGNTCHVPCSTTGFETVKVDTRTIVEKAEGWTNRYIVTNDDFRGGGADNASTQDAMENICQAADPNFHAISEDTSNFACINVSGDNVANRHNHSWSKGYCNGTLCQGSGWCSDGKQAVEWVLCQHPVALCSASKNFSYYDTAGIVLSCPAGTTLTGSTCVLTATDGAVDCAGVTPTQTVSGNSVTCTDKGIDSTANCSQTLTLSLTCNENQ